MRRWPTTAGRRARRRASTASASRCSRRRSTRSTSATARRARRCSRSSRSSWSPTPTGGGGRGSPTRRSRWRGALGDPRTLARVLTMRALAQWNPRTLADRNVDLIEAWRLAIRHRRAAARRPRRVPRRRHCASRRATSSARRMLLDSLAALAGRLGQPIMRWYDGDRARQALRRRRLAAGGRAAGVRGARDSASARASPTPGCGFSARSSWRASCRERSTPASRTSPALFAEPGSAPPVGPEFTPGRSIPLLVGAAMSAIALRGRAPGGRAAGTSSSSWQELDDLPQDYSTLTILVWAAVACAQLGDRARAERLYALLEPYRGQFVNTGGSWFGAVVHHLAPAARDARRRPPSPRRCSPPPSARTRRSAPRRGWRAVAWTGPRRCLRAAISPPPACCSTASPRRPRELDLPRMQRRAAALRERAAVQRR